VRVARPPDLKVPSPRSTVHGRWPSHSALRRRISAAIVLVAFGAAVVTAAVWPARRFVGVNYVVSEERVPLWLKTIDFVDRDFNLARTARSVVAGVDGDERKALNVFRWTTTNIRPQPPQLPVVDDHVWHVIVRGYGQPDQQADVFTTLLTYVDVPAYWQLIGTPPRELALSFALVDGRWRVFDVANQLIFRKSDGALASPDEIAAQPDLVRQVADDHVTGVDDYAAYFHAFEPPVPPDVLRADLQMTGRRLAFEMKKLIGKEGRVWRIRRDGP
jgi:hypothetical protein